MKNKEKLIVAFLVSVGMFSVVEAKQYVGSLSNNQKQALIRVTDTGCKVAVSDAGAVPAANDTNNSK